MDGQIRKTAAGAAIGLGLLCAVLPARTPVRAQTLDDQLRALLADRPADAPSPSRDAPAAEAPPLEAPAADAAGAEASAVEPPAVPAPSGVAAQMADWIVASGDNDGRPYVIVDKPAANVFVFDADGRLLGAAPVLVGLEPGDESAEGVGDRALSAIRPDERTTPAGRFVAGFGPAWGGRTVLWVDYADAISLHPVITSNPKEQRLKRLRSSAPEDRRITYGCINVPAAFYDEVVLKAFAGGSGIVYILPDSRSLAEVFPAFAAASAGPANAILAGEVAPRPAPADPAPAAADDRPGPGPDPAAQDPAVLLGPVSAAGADETPAK
jgi:hypothetical protein